MTKRPKRCWFAASAVGFYGSRGDEALTRRRPRAPGPASVWLEVCIDWEKEADLAESLGIRLVKLRTGVVLGPNGGALPMMIKPFKAGMGGKLGSGDQWMSWIHLDDLVGLIQHALDKPVSGPMNGTSPNPLTNADFTKKLAHALSRPAVFGVPGFMLKTMFGEMAEVMLASQRVLPRVAEAGQYQFRYPEVGVALENLVTATS